MRRRTLDIGEEERHSPSRQLRHVATITNSRPHRNKSNLTSAAAGTRSQARPDLLVVAR
jgi:hypothetical protein